MNINTFNDESYKLLREVGFFFMIF